MPTPHTDVLIVGAGISGISAAYHLMRDCPDRSFAILERRADIGGTWDLFRYPGIRSDSDMHTLGFGFEPWNHQDSIAEGDAILRYIKRAADKHAIRERVQTNTTVVSASWSSDAKQWRVETRDTITGNTQHRTCQFLWACSGYYDYDRGHAPDFEGQDSFDGTIVHPQHWPNDLDLTDQRVAIIGSGATAISIAPEVARTARDVVMVQRSPSYIVSMPRQDAVGRLTRGLPEMVRHRVVRTKMIAQSTVLYRFCRMLPSVAKRLIQRDIQAKLSDTNIDVSVHFSPSYNPWDERVCLTPNDTFFDAIADGSLRMATGHIDRFTPHGIRLKPGAVVQGAPNADHIDADVIVTATGLRMQLLGGMDLEVDGQPVRIADHTVYKGMMLSDVPNAALSTGYTNASWTLKADLTSAYVCRLLNHLREHDLSVCVPRAGDVHPRPLIDFSSGYIQRAADRLPKQGDQAPWRLYQNYLLDLLSLRYGRLEDDTMTFMT